jgi:hypothetical protein
MGSIPQIFHFYDTDHTENETSNDFFLFLRVFVAVGTYLSSPFLAIRRGGTRTDTKTDSKEIS